MTLTDSAVLAPTEPVVVPTACGQATRPVLELTILGAEERPSSRSLDQGRYVVGSDRECDIVIEADGVQPRHCLLVIGSNRAIIRTYGEAILLNKHLTSESSLAVGDRFWIGAVRIEVRSVGWDEGFCEDDCVRSGGAAAEGHAPVPELISAADEAVLEAINTERIREAEQSRNEEALAADVGRRERRLQEVSALLQECLEEVVSEKRRLLDRAVALETHLTAAALAEETQAKELEGLAKAKVALEADWEKIAESKNEAERLVKEAEVSRRELNTLETSLDEQRQALETRGEELREREAELEKQVRDFELVRRRLTVEQEDLASERVRLASERVSLEGEYEAIESSRREAETLRLSMEAKRSTFERAFAADYVSIESKRANLEERTRELKAAEVEFAWRELQLIEREEQVRQSEAAIVEREQAVARIHSDNVREESSDMTPGNEAAMSKRSETDDVGLPTFEDLPPIDGFAVGDEGANPSISALLGVQKVDPTAQMMERLGKVERMLESLLQGLPTESRGEPADPELTVRDWRRAFKSPSVEEPRPVVIELEDANNSSSVSRYMEQLLIRMRSGNEAVPPPTEQAASGVEDAKDVDAVETACGPTEETEAMGLQVENVVQPNLSKSSRKKMTKEELRAQNSSLREVANLSARQAITKHSFRRYKAELTVKAIISVVAFAIAVFFLTANIQSGNRYLWETVAAFGAVAVIVVDFLFTVGRYPDTTSRGTFAVVSDSQALAAAEEKTDEAAEVGKVENSTEEMEEVAALPQESTSG